MTSMAVRRTAQARTKPVRRRRRRSRRRTAWSLSSIAAGMAEASPGVFIKL
jgi:hypothetical protein